MTTEINSRANHSYSDIYQIEYKLPDAIAPQEYKKALLQLIKKEPNRNIEALYEAAIAGTLITMHSAFGDNIFNLSESVIYKVQKFILLKDPETINKDNKNYFNSSSAGDIVSKLGDIFFKSASEQRIKATSDTVLAGTFDTLFNNLGGASFFMYNTEERIKAISDIVIEGTFDTLFNNLGGASFFKTMSIEAIQFINKVARDDT